MMKLINVGILASVVLMSGCGMFNQEHVHEPSAMDVYEMELSANSKPIYIGKRISHVVTFEYDSAKLPFNAADVVEPHVRHLYANDGLRLVLQGNASSEGSKNYNYELGLSRAEAVKHLFLQLGIDESRLEVLSVGEARMGSIPNRSVIIAY
jgi:outer membrane protein OmpA-like peptidoglycan-associated protein